MIDSKDINNYISSLFLNYREFIEKAIQYDIRTYDFIIKDDLLQDVILEAIKFYDLIKTFEEPQLKKWLRTVIRHKVINHYNSAYVANSETFRGNESSSANITVAIKDRSKKMDLERALLKLQSDNYDQYFLLIYKYYFGYSIKDLSTITGMGVSLVKKKLAKARSFIRKEYSDNDD